MQTLQSRSFPFSSIHSYINSRTLSSVTTVDEIAGALSLVSLSEGSSRNGIFLDYRNGEEFYVLWRSLYRYDTSDQITIFDFATANLRGVSYHDKSNFTEWINILRKRIHGIGNYLFIHSLPLYKNMWVSRIRLVPDEFTSSISFYQKIWQRNPHLFSSVVCDYSGTMFFVLR